MRWGLGSKPHPCYLDYCLLPLLDYLPAMEMMPVTVLKLSAAPAPKNTHVARKRDTLERCEEIKPLFSAVCETGEEPQNADCVETEHGAESGQDESESVNKESSVCDKARKLCSCYVMEGKVYEGKPHEQASQAFELDVEQPDQVDPKKRTGVMTHLIPVMFFAIIQHVKFERLKESCLGCLFDEGNQEYQDKTFLAGGECGKTQGQNIKMRYIPIMSRRRRNTGTENKETFPLGTEDGKIHRKKIKKHSNQIQKRIKYRDDNETMFFLQHLETFLSYEEPGKIQRQKIKKHSYWLGIWQNMETEYIETSGTEDGKIQTENKGEEHSKIQKQIIMKHSYHVQKIPKYGDRKQ
ncbi:hypothetical protein JD844_006337 [Phrynosoma platyrhinos]|uniref:Uncharacterized protein n=1 Tax=Phrynosoma platyrhinos TaxID=52577 RepID=A0ABQ7T1X4_PHRPL|nr:hypothetical protein JD844_006337 [Phrynosoma platyrhinos]